MTLQITRRSLLLAAAMPTAARAQARWPSGTISFVAPAPAGGSLDVIARMAQPGLQQRLGVPVLVENRSGAGTSLGAAFVAKGPRDGSRWLINADPQALNPALLPSLPFDTEKDLDPILLIGTAPNVLAVNPRTPFRTLVDVLAGARAAPGISYAVLADTLAHVSMVLLNKMAGTHLTPVTYRGAVQATTDVVGGHLPVVASSISVLAPFFASGDLRAIAQTGTQRHPTLPDVPTIAESGFPGFSAVSFWGLYAPSSTEAAIVDRFCTEVTATLREPEILRRLQSALMIDVALKGIADFRPFFLQQVRHWGEVIRSNGLQHTR